MNNIEKQTSELESLTEATVFNGQELPDANDQQLLTSLSSPMDPQWDELYKKYSDQRGVNPNDYYTIHASHLTLKNTSHRLNSSHGFIIYDDSEATKSASSRVLKRAVTVINDITKLNLTQDEKQASIFTRDDAEEFVKALKKSPEVKLITNKFEIKQAPRQSVDEKGNYAASVLNRFFCVLTEDDRGDRFIQPILQFLVMQCNKRNQSPLVTNSILRVLGEMSKLEKDQNVRYSLSINMVNKINNLLYDQPAGISRTDFVTHDEFLSGVLYNPNIYKLTENDIENVLLDSYRYINRLSLAKFRAIFGFDISEEDRTKIAENVMLIGDENGDPIDVFIKTGKITEDAITNLPNFPDKAEGLTIKTATRAPVSIKAFAERIKSQKVENEEDDKLGYFLQVVNSGKLVSVTELETASGGKLVLKNGNVELKFKDALRFVYCEGLLKDSLKQKAIAFTDPFDLSNADAKKILEINGAKELQYIDNTNNVTLTGLTVINSKNGISSISDIKYTTEAIADETTDEETEEVPVEEEPVPDETIKVTTEDGNTEEVQLSELVDAFQKLSDETGEDITKIWGRIGHTLNQRKIEKTIAENNPEIPEGTKTPSTLPKGEKAEDITYDPRTQKFNLWNSSTGASYNYENGKWVKTIEGKK